MEVRLPELALVLLVGPAGAGKTTFALRHFAHTEVISSDNCRALVADDATDQSATSAAFGILHHVVEARLRHGRFTVVDATNVKAESRRPLIAIARRAHVPVFALVFDLPAAVCLERDAGRTRRVGGEVITRHIEDLRRSMYEIGEEGFRHIQIFRTPEEMEAAKLSRVKLPSNRKELEGPFDVIGDVHGCFEELKSLIERLGYQLAETGGHFSASHPQGRKLVFCGDLVDRGPGVDEVLRLVIDLVEEGSALSVRGNHEAKLLKALMGREVSRSSGLQASLDQLANRSPDFRSEVIHFLSALPSHLQLDRGRLVVAHAGLPAGLQGRDSPKVEAVSLYGQTHGGKDAQGFPRRIDWAAAYRGDAVVAYGHTPVEEPRWCNGTVNLDTGCVFGGNLTALRWPEKVTVSVPALQAWVPHAANA